MVLIDTIQIRDRLTDPGFVTKLISSSLGMKEGRRSGVWDEISVNGYVKSSPINSGEVWEPPKKSKELSNNKTKSKRSSRNVCLMNGLKDL